MKRKNLIKVLKSRQVLFNEKGQVLYTWAFSKKEAPVFIQCTIRKIS